MTGLDTNVLVRCVMRDDPRQSSRATCVIEALLRSNELVIDRADLVMPALSRFSSRGADFADALVERMAASAGCTVTMTFDLGAVRSAAMSLVP